MSWPLRLQPAQNSYEPTQQESVQIEVIPKKPVIQPRPVQKDYSREALTRYLHDAFVTYGIEEQIPRAIEVIQCESGFRVDPPHNNISWGVAQFTPPTWADYGHGDIMNPYAQLDVMAKMFSLGLQNRWDCFSGRR